MHLKGVRNVCLQVKLPFRLSLSLSFFCQPLLNFLRSWKRSDAALHLWRRIFVSCGKLQGIQSYRRGSGTSPLISLYLLYHAARPQAHHSADVWPVSMHAVYLCTRFSFSIKLNGIFLARTWPMPLRYFSFSFFIPP